MRLYPSILTCWIAAVARLISAREPGVSAIANVCCDDGECFPAQNPPSIVGLLNPTSCSSASINLTASFLVAEALHFGPNLTLISIYGSSANIVITCMQSSVNVGFHFYGIEEISLVNVAIEKCGLTEVIDPQTLFNYSSAIYFIDCINIFLHHVNVTDSSGSGVTMLNNSGAVNIYDCSFENNMVPRHLAGSITGGSGIFLILNDVHHSSTSIQDCLFLKNVASSLKSSYAFSVTKHSEVLAGNGGGVYVSVVKESSLNSVSINSCIFRGNRAIWGGGIYLRYYGLPINNTISVSNAVFEDNFANFSGGGFDAGFVLVYNGTSDFVDNFVRFEHCNFTRNSARQYGGGGAIFATPVVRSDPNVRYIMFDDCMWEGNSALGGSALDIAPSVEQIHVYGIYPVPQFTDCKFIANTINSTNGENLENDDLNVTVTGVGAVLVTGFTIKLKGETLFAQNSGTALYSSSGIIEFLESSVTSFYGNSGVKGGAISMMTFSLIQIDNNATLEFINNTASLKGGAIFAYSGDPHEYSISRNCFIQRRKSENDDSGINFVFEGNRVLSNMNFSSDVFTSSVKSCGCQNYSGRVMEAFLCIGNVIARDFKLTTSVNKFQLNGGENYTASIFSNVIPGPFYYQIPVTAYDAYDNPRDVVYEVIYSEDSSLKPVSDYVSQNLIQFRGNINTSDVLKLETDKSTLSFDIKSSNSCPPGFDLDNIRKVCVCASQKYFGVAYCNYTNAYIIHGFWIGLCGDRICTSHCPLGFCNYDDKRESTHKLPNDTSKLEQLICGSKRAGILCGSCSENHSAYYHSYRYACGKNDHCRYGPLIYIASELLPLTLMFFIIIVFDIKFTSGFVNGFIFFAQVLDSISIDANGVISFPITLHIFTAFHRLLYRTLNFDFFSVERFSFCLWSGATSLDAMIMKYATVFYAILLIGLLVVFMNTWKFKRAFSCWRPRTIHSSAKNGLTAFIVICYSQCARVSFQIVSPVYLYGIDYTIVSQVVFRRGEYEYFRPNHLRYALPALAVLLVMSMVPFLLVLYPLIFKLLAFCKLSESKLANMMSRFLPIPLLDSFQSSFKDNCRFFAGLYFLYRLMALATYAYSSTLIVFYTFVELQLIVILALHAVVQPYKERWHNVIDSLVFANLAIINGLTLFNYYMVINGGVNDRKKENFITAALSVQAILIYVPLFYIVAYLLWIVYRKVGARVIVVEDPSLVSSLELPSLRDEDDQERLLKEKKEALLSQYTYGN